jgi:phenylacetyl-CoA:acceptor oxidoreductase subunit 1
MTRWGMVIDLTKCIGCGACSIVCGQTNQISVNKLRRVFDCGISGPPDRQRIYLPISCMHCSKPPCLDVCPTNATYRRDDGIIDIKYELCIGCGYCIVACPYHARSIVFQNGYDLEIGTGLQELKRGEINYDRIGVCTKCNFCLSRIDAGMTKGLQPGVDPEASPVCVISCSAGALYFGNLNDPDSLVSELIRENKAVCLQEELGTDPSIYYVVD